MTAIGVGLTSVWTAWAQDGAAEAVRGLDRPQPKEAKRAARRGPVPFDPAVRAAAAALAAHQVVFLDRQAPVLRVLLVVLAATTVALAVWFSPWGLLLALLWAPIPGAVTWRRRRSRRRSELLTGSVEVRTR